MPEEYDFLDQLKNDFQNAKKRNLHTWTQWRIRLNDKLVEAVLNGVELKDIEPISRYMNREVPDPDHPTTNPKTLLSYSAAENTSTNLRRKNFYKYGIPRAKIDPSTQESMIKSKLKNDHQVGQVWRSFEMTSPPPSPDDGDFALDYFNFGDMTNAPPAENGKLLPVLNSFTKEPIRDRVNTAVSRNVDHHQTLVKSRN